MDTVSPERLEGERISRECAAIPGAGMAGEVTVQARLWPGARSRQEAKWNAASRPMGELVGCAAFCA